MNLKDEMTESPDSVLDDTVNYLGARVASDGPLNQGVEHTPWGDYEHTQINCRCNQKDKHVKR